VFTVAPPRRRRYRSTCCIAWWAPVVIARVCLRKGKETHVNSTTRLLTTSSPLISHLFLCIPAGLIYFVVSEVVDFRVKGP